MDVMDYQRIQRFGFDKQAILDACYILKSFHLSATKLLETGGVKYKQ